MFITYYINIGSEVIKVCADNEHKDYFLNGGAVLLEEEATSDIPVFSPDAVKKAVPAGSGDDGSGEPFTAEFHINHIQAMEDKESIIEYMDKLGLDFDKRGGAEIVRDKAIERIRLADTEAIDD